MPRTSSATLRPPITRALHGPADDIVAEQCAASLALVAAADAGLLSALGPRRSRVYDWSIEPVIATDTDPTVIGVYRPHVDENPDDRWDTLNRGWVR